ncbi:MAG: nucleotidyltransferase domain-containing protein [Bacteroidota bacterium]
MKKDIYIDMIKECVLSELAGENVSLALFGSMAGEGEHAGSDVDVAVMPHGAWNEHRLTILREKLEEMNAPYKVDLVDFSVVSQDFRRVALQKIVWWQR